jgi:AraC family transcriptional regulator
MKTLKTGEFYGNTNETIRLEGITLTDTEYTHEKVDWHYHENAYFTFILEGMVLEGNKKESYECTAGSLLFHNWQDAHYNIKPNVFTRGFHIELEPGWFSQYDISTVAIQGNLQLTHPSMKVLLYNIFKESKLAMGTAQPAIDALLIQLFSLLNNDKETHRRQRPAWVQQLKDLLQDAPEGWTLTGLAKLLDIHPVHLSRDFSKHFHCTLGEYTRTLQVQRALCLLPDTRLSMTDIALQSGFADQSHFIRSFKALHHITPFHYRKILLKKRKC